MTRGRFRPPWCSDLNNKSTKGICKLIFLRIYRNGPTGHFSFSEKRKSTSEPVCCTGLFLRRSHAALATGVGSDTQKPFAIVVVAGLISRLLLGFFVNQVLYEIVARDGDILQV
jgi:hypothetical protein